MQSEVSLKFGRLFPKQRLLVATTSTGTRSPCSVLKGSGFESRQFTMTRGGQTPFAPEPIDS